MEKVDIVISYVNGLDPEWQKIYKQYREDIDFTRFDGHDILKYVFRSIDKYVHWVGKIHLLVMQESQVPNWIDQNKVHIVYHRDFIPEKHLPVFNSCAIEMYLWNIPGLNENFIYMNDDIIFNNIVDIKDYFDDEMNPLVCLHKTNYSYHNNPVFLDIFINSMNLAATGTENKPWNEETKELIRVAHTSNPMSLGYCKQIYDIFKDKIESSITRFRESKNYNQYIYSAILVFYGISKLYKKKRGSSIRCVQEHFELIQKNLNSNRNELCINDVEETTVNDKVNIMIMLDNKFPEKSKYEI
jgi:hypothetical protein